MATITLDNDGTVVAPGQPVTITSDGKARAGEAGDVPFGVAVAVERPINAGQSAGMGQISAGNIRDTVTIKFAEPVELSYAGNDPGVGSRVFINFDSGGDVAIVGAPLNSGWYRMGIVVSVNSADKIAKVQFLSPVYVEAIQ